MKVSVHSLFDLAAALGAMAATAGVYAWRIRGAGVDPAPKLTGPYLVALVAGAALGGYGFGTANLWLSGLGGFGRSILGALAGAIAAVEIYKASVGARGSTGIVFVAGFATSVAIGRLGCLFSGMDDETYGVPTGGAWGWDFGDHKPRHPVALYESLAMAAFLVYALAAFARRDPRFLRNGFYVLVGYYALQRFLWEFLKPYATLAGPFNLFQFLCLALLVYSAVMVEKGRP